MNLLMKNILVILLFILSAGLSRAQIPEGHKIHILTKAHNLKQARLETGFDFEFSDPSQEEVLKRLEAGDEIIIEGTLTYRPITLEGRSNLNPILMIEKINPISLNRLGRGNYVMIESQFKIPTEQQQGRGIIPVSNELVAAVTATASLLLLQSLTMEGHGGPTTFDRLNTGLMLGAGAMASSLFVFDDFWSKKSNL